MFAAHKYVLAKVTVEFFGSCSKRLSRSGSWRLALSIAIFACKAAGVIISNIFEMYTFSSV